MDEFHRVIKVHIQHGDGTSCVIYLQNMKNPELKVDIGTNGFREPMNQFYGIARNGCDIDEKGAPEYQNIFSLQPST